MADTATTAGTTDPVIEAHGVKKRFDGGENAGVLRGVDLAIRGGETTVLMGPNGVGKTVLLACLAGGLHPSAGEIRVFGQSPSAVGARLSFMLQDALAVDELTGRENLDFYADLHPAATDDWRAITERLDLADLDRRVREYSGGMIRKLELAATLSVDVPLYLLDEPTVELDLTAIEEVHALLDERVDGGKTVVMTSHTPRDARAADRLVFASEGRIVADGDPDTLLDSMPPVVGIGARVDIETFRENLLARRTFEGDATRRGFLAGDGSPERFARSTPGVEVAEPTWTDLFNYSVHVVPSLDDPALPRSNGVVS